MERKQAHAHYLAKVNELAPLVAPREHELKALEGSYAAASSAEERARLSLDLMMSTGDRLSLVQDYAEACINLAASKGRFGQNSRAAAMHAQTRPVIDEARASANR